MTPNPLPGDPPVADLDIPEINTQFIDNLFTDPTFVDRFDVAFGQTVHIGLDMEMQQPAKHAGPDNASQEQQGLLEILFPKTPP